MVRVVVKVSVTARNACRSGVKTHWRKPTSSCLWEGISTVSLVFDVAIFEP